MNPIISVILPVYNGERYLSEAIDSVLNQTYAHFELIIIDDASTDNTASIIAGFGKTDNRIKYVKNDVNLKVVATLNKGVDLAKGKYIARMDADDISLPERFSEQIGFLESHPETGMVDVQMEYIDENGTRLHQFNSFTFDPGSIKRQLAKNNVLGHSSIMIRAEILKRFKYRQTWYEDYELWLRLINGGYQITKLDKRLLLYRIHHQSITGIANSDGTHFYKLAMAKASYLYSVFFNRFRISWFNIRVFYYMAHDFLLYFYKKIKR